MNTLSYTKQNHIVSLSLSKQVLNLNRLRRTQVDFGFIKFCVTPLNKLLATIMLMFFFAACVPNQKHDQTEVWKKEILDAERAFDSLAQVTSIQQAFVTFAAEEVTVLRNNNLIKGKSALKNYFVADAQTDKVSLTWKPDFVDVSASGDLGYTYGKYVYAATDSLGNTKSNEGIFHTVWKRQQDGSWKFVWD